VFHGGAHHDAGAMPSVRSTRQQAKRRRLVERLTRRSVPEAHGDQRGTSGGGAHIAAPTTVLTGLVCSHVSKRQPEAPLLAGTGLIEHVRKAASRRACRLGRNILRR